MRRALVKFTVVVGIPALQVLAPVCAAAAPEPPTLGKTLFERNCAICHGIGGGGGRGPPLNRAQLPLAPDDAALRALIKAGVPPEMPPGSFFMDNDVVALATYVRVLGAKPQSHVSGNVEQGAEVFRTRGCVGCHIFAGQGVGYGPSLNDISARRSADYVMQEITDPSAKLPPDFLMVRAMSPDGKVIHGIRVNEDNFTLQVKDPGGKFHSFRKSELAELQRLENETPMPRYASVLSNTELHDLVAYLFSPPAQEK